MADKITNGVGTDWTVDANWVGGIAPINGTDTGTVKAGHTMDEVPDGATCLLIEATGTVTMNNGTIVTNNGLVTENAAVIQTNGATGHVTWSYGTITTNNHVVTTNDGTVSLNSGTVTSNVGTITVNDGAIGHNYGAVLTNELAGTVTHNTELAFVRINNGTITLNDGTVHWNTYLVSENTVVGEIIWNVGGTVTLNSGLITDADATGTVVTNNGLIMDNCGTISGGTGIPGAQTPEEAALLDTAHKYYPDTIAAYYNQFATSHTKLKYLPQVTPGNATGMALQAATGTVQSDAAGALASYGAAKTADIPSDGNFLSTAQKAALTSAAKAENVDTLTKSGGSGDLAAVKTKVDTNLDSKVSAVAASVLADIIEDTENIQSRLPPALLDGRMPSMPPPTSGNA